MSFRRAGAFALIFLTTVTVSASHATTYYVSPTGNATNPGTLASPWSLAKANSSLVAGDVAILAAGNYGTTGIAPANSGASYANFIAYVGSLSNPASTVVASVNVSARSYVSVKGVQFAGNVTFAAPHDSIAYCVAPTGVVRAGLGGDDCVVAWSTFTGEQMEFSGGANGATPTFLSRDTLSNCTFNLNQVTSTVSQAVLRIYTTDQLYFERCRFFMNIGPTGNHGTFKMYGGRRGKFIDCLFDYQSQRSSSGCDECNTSYYRDYTMFNLFQRDTFLVHGSNAMALMPEASGSFPNTTQGNRWDQCVFRMSAPTSVTAMMFWQNGARSDTLTNNTFVTNGIRAVDLYGWGAGCLVKNNTFINLSPGSPVTLSSWNGQVGLYNNIFYTPTGGSTGLSGTTVVADATGASNWVANNNLYYCTNGSNGSVYFSGTARGPGPTGTMCTVLGQECASKFGDPLFVGGADVMSFDARLNTGSPAIGAGLGGVDMGALQSGSGSGDLTPPSTVSNMASTAVTASSITLQWTAPGDNGGTGTAMAYDLRRSTSTITAANFVNATPVNPQPSPLAGGSTQTYTASSLAPSTTYHFAIRAVDWAGNWSTVSSDVAVTTGAGPDTTPPATIGDLR